MKRTTHHFMWISVMRLEYIPLPVESGNEVDHTLVSLENGDEVDHT